MQDDCMPFADNISCTIAYSTMWHHVYIRCHCLWFTLLCLLSHIAKNCFCKITYKYTICSINQGSCLMVMEHFLRGDSSLVISCCILLSCQVFIMPYVDEAGIFVQFKLEREHRLIHPFLYSLMWDTKYLNWIVKPEFQFLNRNNQFSTKLWQLSNHWSYTRSALFFNKNDSISNSNQTSNTAVARNLSVEFQVWGWYVSIL